MRDTTDYEDRLRQRIESIVASVVGAGHVQVQVAADMNYNHTQTTTRRLRSRHQGRAFDPDGRAECLQHHPAAASAVSVANALPSAARLRRGDTSKYTSGRTEETTNYEISKKVTTSTVDGGDVKKLSVAVVVDGIRRYVHRPTSRARRRK